MLKNLRSGPCGLTMDDKPLATKTASPSGDVTISLSGEKRGTAFCDLSIIQN